MVNMGVIYQRPNRSLSTYTAELRAKYGDPDRTYEYVTGYKSPSNISGHNADNNGVVHSVDVFVGPGNLTEAQGIAEAELLRVEGTKGTIPGHPDRLAYIIHRQRIAGDHTGWAWIDYTGPDGHYDHIHVSSVFDYYWGDPVAGDPLDYDNSAAWNLGGTVTKPQGTTITPIAGGLTMADINTLTKQLTDIQGKLADIETSGGKKSSLRQFIADGTRAAQTAAAQTSDINTSSGPQSLRSFVAQGTRAAQATQADNAALRNVVEQLATAKGTPIDYGKVEAAVAKALKDGTVTVDVTVAGGK